jgi:hypothetical protein
LDEATSEDLKKVNGVKNPTGAQTNSKNSAFFYDE